MTDAEWQQSRNLVTRVRAIDPCRFDRKLRLFAVACCRRVADLLRDPDARALLELVEGVADGAADPESLRPVWGEVPWYPHAEGAVKLAAALDCASWRASADCYRRAAQDAEAATAGAMAGDTAADAQAKYERRGRERAAQLALLRDVVGSPFRAVTFLPVWGTDTAVALARQMYESRDFSAMPILADALQDAGCDSEAILSHCRDASATHVRGCWVVDLVLGKE